MAKTFVLQSIASNKDFKVNYQKELNQEQYQVVTGAEGPCLVLAGAGSGKTRTIVYRVAYLIERGVDPENILLVTFTNKAAHEMLFRVEQLLGQSPAGLWGGTFHHIGNRILRKYPPKARYAKALARRADQPLAGAPKLSYRSNFSILDEEDSKDLIKVCLKEEEIDLKARRFPSPAVIKDLLSYAKNSQGNLEEIIADRHPKWLLASPSRERSGKIADQIKKISLKYEQKKQSANSMDFDDLLVNWLKMLKQFPQIKDRLSAQFHYILVDEYQDTNYLQAEIVKELSQVHHNVLVVGDDAQSIYSFRAADIGNILNFSNIFPNTKIFKLQTNYRSTPEILKVANQVIENNREQFPKVLKPVLAAFVKPNVVPAASGSQEAKFIVEQILQLNSEGLPFNKMAVLFRAAFHSQELEFELTKRDIAYEYRGGVRFFERSHVKDVLAFLKVINNPADEVAWHRILNLQTGIGEATASRIYQRVKHIGDIGEIINLDLDDVLTPKSEIGWRGLVGIFKKFDPPALLMQVQRAGIKNSKLNRNSKLEIQSLIRNITKSNYKDYLEAEYPNFQERLDDLEQLALFSENYDDLNVFLSEMSLQESFSASAASPSLGASADRGEKLILSTIHQAKGLEWQAVFIINLTDNAFPNSRALGEDGGLEEERRLFYVAITRAQKQLFLTYPIIGSRATMYLNNPSQFLMEIDEDLLEEVKLIEKTIWNRKDLNDGNVSYLPDLDSL